MSQHSWPVGDAFFIAPGKLAREVFRAVDALGQDSHCDASQVEEIGNAGVVESALHRHLASRKIPTQLYDGFAFVAARWREGGDCRGLKQVHAVACVLAANEGLVSDECQAAVTRPYEEGCRRDFPPLGGESPPPRRWTSTTPRGAPPRRRNWQRRPSSARTACSS